MSTSKAQWQTCVTYCLTIFTVAILAREADKKNNHKYFKCYNNLETKMEIDRKRKQQKQITFCNHRKENG